MAIYAIGDIQGCFRELQELLRHIRFQRGKDQLWLVGDLVNRGPESLAVLRFVSELGRDARVVLGNHDLNLIAIAEGVREMRPGDTIQEILDAPDGGELIDWLAERPLLLREPGIPYTMVHAGLAPPWDIEQAALLAREVEAALAGTDRAAFLAHMYGNQPDRWNEKLANRERLRFITNALTRIRYVDSDGRLEMGETGPPGSQPDTLTPWFAWQQRASHDQPIIFGHWATLQLTREVDPAHRVFHLDTGCVWGGRLTALRLDDQRYFSVQGQQKNL